MPLIYSRPEKLNHIDTIRYEIYMLRYSYQQLAEENAAPGAMHGYIWKRSFSTIETLSTSLGMKAHARPTFILRLFGSGKD